MSVDAVAKGDETADLEAANEELRRGLGAMRRLRCTLLLRRLRKLVAATLHAARVHRPVKVLQQALESGVDYLQRCCPN